MSENNNYNVPFSINGEGLIYQELRDKILLAIASGKLKEGEALPPVRRMAEILNVNLHTVSKSYACLAKENILRMAPCKRTVVKVKKDAAMARESLRKKVRVVIAEAVCREMPKKEVLAIVDEVYDSFQNS